MLASHNTMTQVKSFKIYNRGGRGEGVLKCCCVSTLYPFASDLERVGNARLISPTRPFTRSLRWERVWLAASETSVVWVSAFFPLFHSSFQVVYLWEKQALPLLTGKSGWV